MINRIIAALSAGRLREVERFRRRPAEVQGEQLERLLAKGAATAFGRDHGLWNVKTPGEFQARVPVRGYEEFFPYIERTRRGERDVLWPGETRWFARSSGTTGSKSKYIPVTGDSLADCHMRGPKDCIAFNVERYPRTGVWGGKTLTLGGSRRMEREGENALTGDLSAILIENMPAIGRRWRVPRKETALLPDFEHKVERICAECEGEDVRSLAGVPSWNLVMLRRLLDRTGAANLSEVWPRLELFIHGGVNFAPYRDVYRQLIPSEGMHYMETYNASEGFFGIADEFGEDMLLMLDYGMYYEFLPLARLDDPSCAVPLEGVREGVNYAIIITNSGGLWRYMIGDTVVFTSTDPYRIRISGRTRQYMNAFGEEIIVDNAERAVRVACRETGAEVTEYTAAPVFMEIDSKGAHQWVVEFGREPRGGADAFAAALDRALTGVNSDYEAKRWRNTTLMPPVVTAVPPGTFMRWMAAREKAGGQNKVPRLANDRRYVDDILSIVGRRPGPEG
ncbi:MAG: GH3 auxin-responsive promoter family protein [Alistipes sp.]|jgi:hypothetical protein|nr:GH3 auxin-responsive promoter family protein [Alistipes sp.]